MGRRAKGYSLRKHGDVYSVRFTVDGQRQELSTGQTTRSAADRVGRALYAAALRGKIKRTQRPTGPGQGIEEVGAAWLEVHVARHKTRELYAKYVRYWSRAFDATSNLTERRIAHYLRVRLGEVRGKTVRNEAHALNQFLLWLAEVGVIPEVPKVLKIEKSATGTPYKHRRRTRAPEIEPNEVEQILGLLPETSATGYAIRDRFIVAYDTTLRPETLDKLKVPDNFSIGSPDLTIDDEDDKENYSRVIPLTSRSKEALERWSHQPGLIFGSHRYNQYLRAAARKVLPRHKAEVFTGQHFRSAAITHYLERSGNLPGVQHLAGHKHTSTTGKYVRPTYKAAAAVIQSPESSGKNSGKEPKKGEK